MRAELKRLHSPDVPDLSTYIPEVHNEFGFLLQLMIGPAGTAGEESFDVFVCTPEWLKQNRSPESIISGLHYLIVFDYNYQRLNVFLQDHCREYSGTTWQDIAVKLSCFGKWEFEDYKPINS